MPPVQPELTSQQSTLCLAARAASPRCRSSSGNSLCGQNSAGFRESARPFKGIICDDISGFESYHPSHAVWSPPLDSALSARGKIGLVPHRANESVFPKNENSRLTFAQGKLRDDGPVDRLEGLFG